MIGLITLDLVLRLIIAGMDGVTFELGFGCDHVNDLAADAASFRIPTHVITLAKPPLCRRLSF